MEGLCIVSRLAMLLACVPLTLASAPATAPAPNLTSSDRVDEVVGVAAPSGPEDLVSGDGNMSLDLAEQDRFFRCGALMCARPSICCMSKTMRNWVSGVPTAICCAPESGCRFVFFNKTSGIRTVNARGEGEPRCFACAWWRLRQRGAKKTGCEDRCGGSICCGGNKQCVATKGR
mmetsp:Transcript_20876/g.52771  ORF Transcript_20876/g.52771 Transcript_20876/m.52771 type:complete len:175 (-) Transcript_20876:89-613(-)